MTRGVGSDRLGVSPQLNLVHPDAGHADRDPTRLRPVGLELSVIAWTASRLRPIAATSSSRSASSRSRTLGSGIEGLLGVLAPGCSRAAGAAGVWDLDSLAGLSR